jgi:hypothetical protein
MKNFFIMLGFNILLGLLVACNFPGFKPAEIPIVATEVGDQSAVSDFNPPDTNTATLQIPTTTPIPPTKTISPQPTATHTPAPTQTPSITPTGTDTPSPTSTPTYAILRGQVLPERANCRYGPGAPYLYKYGLVGGSNLEIIGRNAAGTWVLIQAIGGNNPCWVKAELMNIKGDVIAMEPKRVDIIQAWSPYYPPLTGVSASRTEANVTVFWNPITLRAGDDSGQIPYVVEAWVCQAGQIVFVSIGSYGIAAEVTDEPGCETESRGQVMAAEKHGYTRPIILAWPQAEE